MTRSTASPPTRLCCTLKDKTVGNRIDDTTGGNSGVEPRLAVMYTEMVSRRGYSLTQYAGLVSPPSHPACRKGAIAAGKRHRHHDPRPRRGKVRATNLHETNYTPWEGHEHLLHLAGGDDPARQGDGGEWPIFGNREMAAISSARFGRTLKRGLPCERHANRSRA